VVGEGREEGGRGERESTSDATESEERRGVKGAVDGER